MRRSRRMTQPLLSIRDTWEVWCTKEASYIAEARLLRLWLHIIRHSRLIQNEPTLWSGSRGSELPTAKTHIETGAKQWLLRDAPSKFCPTKTVRRCVP